MANPIGFKLPGMVPVDKSVSTSFAVTDNLKTALEFSTSHFVRVRIVKDSIDGSRIMTPDSRKAESKLGEVRKSVGKDGGGIFVLFGYSGNDQKCLIVSYIPENMAVRQKMLFAGSKGLLQKTIKDVNPRCVLDNYTCAELKQISEEVYTKLKNAEKPFSEAEKLRQEEDAAEKAGGYNIIARLKEMQDGGAAPAYALPGFGIGMKPSEVKKDRIASMKVARDKDAQRVERVNFFVKLRKEKELMEREQMEAEEARQKQENQDSGTGQLEELNPHSSMTSIKSKKSNLAEEEQHNSDRKSSDVAPDIEADDVEDEVPDVIEPPAMPERKPKKDSIDDVV